MRTSGIPVRFYRLCLAVSIVFASAAICQAAWLTIHNDFYQYDTAGKRIETRSGCLQKFGSKYYWYGSAFNFNYQTCYSSTDLRHWVNEDTAIGVSGTNRMDVLYNDSTKLYVMYLKTQNGTNCDLGIATSPTPDGKFTLKGNSKVFGYQIGDMSVWKDDDGQAYMAYVWDSVPNANSGDKSEQGLARLSPDYQSVAQRLMTWHVGSREGNMLMKHDGLYYYMTSLTLWTQSTKTKFHIATNIAGPWNTTFDTLSTPGSTNSWDTQCDFVFTFPGTQGTVWMYCGDRWERPNPLRLGDYAWLPFSFSPKDSPVVNYYQDWEVDPVAGTWRPFDLKRNLALHKTATASSVNGSNIANNVTDSTTYSNYTSTRWTSAASDTQWVMVDLGSPLSINRVILKWDSAYAKAFQIQVATDTTKWNTVFSTPHGGMRSCTDESFPTTTARYVRMYGTQRGNTSAGYSLFDFMVLNDSGITATAPVKSSVPEKELLTCKGNTVHFSLPSGDNVRLAVLDLRGKQVAVLVDKFMQAGNHETVLPSKLSNGKYIIRLTTGSKTLATMQVRL